jgi:protein-S-isoprenylcysteine O-methyltransferase Ste14
MSGLIWIKDIILYVVVILGILLYKSTLFRLQSQAGRLTQKERKRQNFGFVIMFCTLTLLFVVGVLHQTGLISGYISIGAAILFATVGMITLGWIRRFTPQKK